MAIGVKGIRIDSITVAKDGDAQKVTAHYALISTLDKVLAKQEIGGYNGLEVGMSADTVKALDAFLAAYKADVNKILGLETD